MQYAGVARASVFTAVGTRTGCLSSFVSVEHRRIASLSRRSLLAWSKITEFSEVAYQLRSDMNGCTEAAWAVEILTHGKLK